MAKKRLVVLISGNGSNLQAIIDAIETGELEAEIVAVIANLAGAYGLERAQTHHLPHHILPKPKTQSRQHYDEQLASLVLSYKPDYIVLAGWLRLLSLSFLQHFPNQVINLHPAQPGAFPGLHAIERAFEAYERGEIREGGVMVHFVPDEGVDDGPVIFWDRVAIYPQDSLESFRDRVRGLEHHLLIKSLKHLP